jgi:IclR family transcriptional regulator, acetate operon repressor
MAVKQVKSATRVLATFEAVAEHQPIGVSALSRLLDDDKSALQRALMTLADAGWIDRVGDGTHWGVSARVLGLVQRRAGLRERARATLEALRDETDETIILNVAEDGQIVILDVAESSQLIRAAPKVGLVVSATDTAAGQAIIANLPDTQVPKYLGGRPPNAALRANLAEVRLRSWALNVGAVYPDARAVGAAILDADQHAIASITVSGPADRMPPHLQDALGPVVAAAARRLSAR